MITSVPTTEIDCKSIVSTLMKNRFIHESMSKIRQRLTDIIIKKEIAIKSSIQGWNQDHYKPHWRRWILKTDE